MKLLKYQLSRDNCINKLSTLKISLGIILTVFIAALANSRSPFCRIATTVEVFLADSLQDV